MRGLKPSKCAMNSKQKERQKQEIMRNRLRDTAKSVIFTLAKKIAYI